jgi:acyl-CoA reductase-like NAD-dependent aldehyde dehydrogenase
VWCGLTRRGGAQYGGIKSSGVGREGLRYTIEEFTEPKILLTKDLGKL